MIQKIDVIKIGGSLLFDKVGRFRISKVKEVLSVIRRLKYPSVVVIGCGSILHEVTLKSNLTDKPQLDSNGVEKYQALRLRKFSEIYRLINDNLNKISKLFEDTITIHPAQMFVKKSNGSNTPEIDWFHRDFFLKNKKKVVITSGGIVHDRNILFSAISSDTISAFLAAKLKANRLILLTDTEGVYKSMKQKETLLKIRYSQANLKLTGGMERKIKRIKMALTNNVPTYISSGISIKSVKDVILNNDFSKSSKVII